MERFVLTEKGKNNMGIYMPNIEKPKQCAGCQFEVIDTTGYPRCVVMRKMVVDGNLFNRCPLVEIPTPHGRLIDANKLEAMMYHEAFEIDSDMQKWDSGCWIRYKVFENCMNRLLPDTILETEE